MTEGPSTCSGRVFGSHLAEASHPADENMEVGEGTWPVQGHTVTQCREGVRCRGEGSCETHAGGIQKRSGSFPLKLNPGDAAGLSGLCSQYLFPGKPPCRLTMSRPPLFGLAP